MLKFRLRPWRFRDHARPNVSYRNSSLIVPSRVAAHGRHFNHAASYLTHPRVLFSMPPHKRSSTNFDRPSKIRIIRQPMHRRGKMDVHKLSQPLPAIELTPLEEIIKTLLLDVKEYIEQKEETKGHSTQGDMVLRFTGGWVRDKLLGVTSHDIDVAISSMTGLQFGTYLKEYLDDPVNLAKYQNYDKSVLSEDMLKVHKIEANPEKSKHLETVTTKLFGLDIDLVNLRKETYTEHSRNPQMEFGTAEEDALRRDATVNAMFYNLNTEKLEDFTGLGRVDMERKLIRTPLEPYQTFKDDPLRVLRLIRFASRLGYRIDEKSQTAMQNNDIKDALKLKISKERVGAEVEKMLQGPDPRTALKYIDELGLYSTIFANQQDETEAHTTAWSLAYDALNEITCHHKGEAESYSDIEHIKQILISDESDLYHAWVIAAFVPWAPVPMREPRSKLEKPPPMARAAEVARDNLRMENKTISFLKDAAAHYEEVSSLKDSVVSNKIPGTAAEVRQHVGLSIRSWRRDWRLIVIMAMLQEIVVGAELFEVIKQYNAFLTYVEKENLLEVTDLKPIANGNEVSAALGVRGGKWLSMALELLIKWQLLNPESADKHQALEVLKSRKTELGL